MAGSLMSMMPASFSNFGKNIGSAFKGFGQDIGLMPRKRRRFTGNPHLGPTPEQVSSMTGAAEDDLSFNQELAMAMSQGMQTPSPSNRALSARNFGRKTKYAPLQPAMAETDNAQFSLVQPTGNNILSRPGRRKRLRDYTGGYA